MFPALQQIGSHYTDASVKDALLARQPDSARGDALVDVVKRNAPGLFRCESPRVWWTLVGVNVVNHGPVATPLYDKLASPGPTAGDGRQHPDAGNAGPLWHLKKRHSGNAPGVQEFDFFVGTGMKADNGISQV